MDLRCSVVPCPNNCGHPFCFRRQYLGTAKVRKNDPAVNLVGSHENILWFNVTVDNVLVVQITQSNQDLLYYRSCIKICDIVSLGFDKCEQVPRSDEFLENISNPISTVTRQRQKGPTNIELSVRITFSRPMMLG